MSGKRIIKKLTAILLTACIPFAGAPVCFADSDTPTYADGSGLEFTADTPIVVAENVSSQDQFAAERLSYYLGLVFGKAPEIVTSTDKKAAYIGSAAKADTSILKENGYVITVSDGNLYIAGTGIRGTIQGVYRFLEDYAGVHNYTSEVISVPACDAINLPPDTHIEYAPFFEYTDTDWHSPKNTEYSIANGLNGSTYRYIPSEQGGNVKYISGFCHTLTTQFCSSSEYFDSHPEYFALHDGERTGNQLCLSNPDTVKLVTEEVIGLLKEKYVDDGSLQIVSVTQNDNYDYCECDNCKTFEDAHGGVHSASMINFVNQIADAVKEAGYKNVAIDTFAYQYTRQAPTGIAPEDNVIVRLCTIECCFKHTLDDPECEQNASLMNDLSDWSEICGRIYVWDYVTNFANTLCVFPDFGVIQRNIQIFYENNVKGVYEEGNYYMEHCDAEFGELRAYMIAKFLQNPYADYDEVVNGFLAAYYGENAARSMRKIIDTYVEHAGKSGKDLSIYCSCKNTFSLSAGDVCDINSLWDEAKNASGITAAQMNNIERSELSWRWYKACALCDEFSLMNPDRFDEKEELYDDIIAAGITSTGESDYRNLVTSPGYSRDYIRYASPDKWASGKAPTDNAGKNAVTFFGRLLEIFTPVFTSFGLIYRIYQMVLK